jgi:hypothetical protein
VHKLTAIPGKKKASRSKRGTFRVEEEAGDKDKWSTGHLNGSSFDLLIRGLIWWGEVVRGDGGRMRENWRRYKRKWEHALNNKKWESRYEDFFSLFSC